MTLYIIIVRVCVSDMTICIYTVCVCACVRAGVRQSVHNVFLMFSSCVCVRAGVRTHRDGVRQDDHVARGRGEEQARRSVL
jgi:hypothetical protein